MLDSTTTAWLVKEHPYLYHAVYRADDNTRVSIAENGLAFGYPRHSWHGLYRPRPGHVYLTTARNLKRVCRWGQTAYATDVYAVATETLVSPRINPDEDWFIADDWISTENMVGTRHPCQTFRLPFPPTQWMWDWAQYLRMGSLPSYGDWADAVDLGRDPAQTAYSLWRGSIAYCGDIPSTALRLVTANAVATA